MIVDDVGTYTLQVRAAIQQASEPAARRERREAVVVALLLAPAVLGLLVSWSPSEKGRTP